MKSIIMALSLVGVTAFAQVIPPARTFTESWRKAGYPGEIPAPDRIVKVTEFGAAGTGLTNDRPAVVAAISSLGGAPGVVFFPAGTYLIQSAFSLPAGTVLRGQRSESTTLLFDFVQDAINISAGQGQPFQPLVAGFGIHSDAVTVSNAAGFSVGDYVEIRETNDPAWGASTWANFVAGQIGRVVAVSNNTLQLDAPMRLDYQAAQNPEIRRINPITECGIENIRLERLIAGDADARDNRVTVRFNYAARCWVRGVESFNGFGGHVGLQYSTRTEVTGCYIHEAHDYDGGGSGYGVRLEFKSGPCLVEDNIFRMLRHAILAQAGVNGNVCGYNYSRENYWNNGINPTDLTSDITGHGNYVFANLYEGNICQHIWLDDSHGQNGPYNTFFRNRAENRGINVSAGQTAGQNYVGNEAYENTYRPIFFLPIWPGDGYSLQGAENFEHGNNTESDGLQAPGTGTLPDISYYLSAQATNQPAIPAFWDIPDTLPTVGPPHAFAPAKNVPASVRWTSGISKTVGPPSIAAQPVDQLVMQGDSVSFSVEAYGTPVAEFQWRRNGIPIAGATNDSIMVVSATPGDAGLYSAMVTDADGNMPSAGAVLTVVSTNKSGTFLILK